MKNRLKIIQESIQSILNEMETYRTYTNKALGGTGEYPDTPVANRFALQFVRKALEDRREGFRQGIEDIHRTTENMLFNQNPRLPNYRAEPLAISRWQTIQRFGKRRDAIKRTLDAIDDRTSSLPKGDVL